jgi:PAS domain S-box-containing protein
MDDRLGEVEITLSEERRFSNTILDTVDALITILDPQGRIVRFYRACEQMTGYSFEEVKDHALWNVLLLPEEVDEGKQIFYSLLAGQFPSEYKNYWLTKDGRQRLIEWSSTALQNNEGMVEYVIATGIDVTDRDLAEETRRKSEARLQAILTESAVGIALIDITGHIMESNPALQNMLGYNARELARLTFADITHPDDLLMDFDFFRELLQGKRDHYKMEKRYIRKDGQMIWGYLTAYRIPNPDGSFQLGIGMIEDVTQRKQTEAAEREHRNLAEALRNSASALNSTLELDEIFDRMLFDIERVIPYDAATILLLDEQDDVMRVARSRGYEERGLGDWVQELTFPLDIKTIRHGLRTGKSLVIPSTHTDPGWIEFPEQQWARSHVQASIQRNGQVIGLLTLNSTRTGFFNERHAEQLQVFADQAAVAIRNAQLYETVRDYAVELEKRVQERTAELAQERAQLQAILDAMGEGVLYIDQNNRIKYINNAFSKMIGYDIEEVQMRGKSIYTALNEPVQNRKDVSQEMERALETGQTWRGEFPIRRRDGTTFDAGLTVNVVLMSNGEDQGRVEVIRDISEATALQAQRDRFIANASHELRTPITNIKMRLYLLRKEPHKLTDHLHTLEAVVGRMEGLVDDLLDVSRFERGIIKLRQEDVVMQDLLERVAEDQHPHADQKQITLEVQIPLEPLHVAGDYDRLVQVFTNLLTNAINYTPETGVITLSLTTESDRDRDFVVARVRDTGIGIPRDQLPNVFEPFFRGAEGAAKGTGLGLTICREIVESHGGIIQVDSEPDKGSVFTVKLELAGKTAIA